MCISELYKVLIYVTYIVPIYISSSLTIAGTYFVTFIDTVFLFILFRKKNGIYPHPLLMCEIKPQRLYFAPLQLPPPMFQRILENNLSLDPKGVAS